jgi:pilus assembly protein Flp/PilA|tara:strand:+ start:669 stop:857 length:189 start_codon:yes stop_codon:yes gene_type:complete
MNRFWYLLARDERGATAVEYGLILALVFLAMVGAVGTFSNQVIGTWDTVRTTSADAVARSDS